MGMQRNDSYRPRSRSDGRGRQTASRAPRKRLNWACFVLVAVIFIGSFVQIYNLVRLMDQNKRIAEDTAYLHELRDQVRNAENALLRHNSINVIQRKAAELGMIEANTTEVRRVPVTVTAMNSDTNAQTAYSGGNQ